MPLLRGSIFVVAAVTFHCHPGAAELRETDARDATSQQQAAQDRGLLRRRRRTDTASRDPSSMSQARQQAGQDRFDWDDVDWSKLKSSGGSTSSKTVTSSGGSDGWDDFDWDKLKTSGGSSSSSSSKTVTSSGGSDGWDDFDWDKLKTSGGSSSSSSSMAIKSVTVFESSAADLKLLQGALNAQTFEMTKDFTIGGLEVHKGDIFMKEIVLGEEKLTIEEVTDLNEILQMKIFPVKLSFKCHTDIDWDSLTGGASRTISITVSHADILSLMKHVTIVHGQFIITGKITLEGGATLNVGDRIDLSGSLSWVKTTKDLSRVKEGTTMKFVTGGSSTVSITVSKTDIRSLMKYIKIVNGQFIITRKITLEGVTLNVGDRIDLSGSLSWVKTIKDLSRVKEGTTVKFVTTTGGSSTTVTSGGSSRTVTRRTVVTNGGSSRTITSGGEKTVEVSGGGGEAPELEVSGGGGGGSLETSGGGKTVITNGGGGETVITSGGGGGTVTRVNIVQGTQGCCSKFPGLRLEIDAIRILVDKEVGWMKQEMELPGPAGPPGGTCKAGRDIAGAPGLPGRDGAPGKPGEPGKDGQPGKAGADGEPGLPGMRGSAGLPGVDGLHGPPGPPGEPGEAGADGKHGALGSPGKPGAPGTPGTPGKPGLVGEPGDDAPEGAHAEMRQMITMIKKGIEQLKAKIGELETTTEGAELKTVPSWTKKQVEEMIKLRFKQLKETQKMLSVQELRTLKDEVVLEMGECNCEAGAMGAPGPKGIEGALGAPGAAGAPGEKGAPGKAGGRGMSGGIGMRGPPGNVGEPGLPGKPGKDGQDGMKGGDGLPGRKGPDGPRGAQGDSGLTGPPGPTGAPGLKGQDGKPGAAGEAGTPGLPGSDGAEGPAGRRGAPGKERGKPGLPGPMGPPGAGGRAGRDGNRGPPGPPGQPAADGMVGPMGPPGPAGADGKNGGMGAPGLPGPAGRDGSPGQNGKDGPPGAEGEPGKSGRDGEPGLPGTSMQGPPGPVGPPGPPGPDGESEEMGELQGAADKSKTQMKKIIELMQEISTSQQLLEKRVEKTKVVQEDSSKEYLHLLDELKVEALEEAELVSKMHCEKTAGAKPQNSCCEDCTKAPWRVPQKSVCQQVGCSHGCAYELTTCDEKGRQSEPCHFPFDLDGQPQTTCVKDSPFGPTKHPWCKTKAGDIALCDCPVAKCTCPQGATLGSDGLTCSGSLLQLPGTEFSPLGLTQLPGSSQDEVHAPAPSPAASLLQSMTSLLR